LPPGHMAGTHRQKLGQPHFESRTKQTAPLKLYRTRGQLAQEALAAWAQARPRTSGSRPALYHVHVNTAGLRASAAMGLIGRLLFDSSNHGLC
jgi:hypothetical protein